MTTRQQASRFLQQTTLGADDALLREVQSRGRRAWLEWQLNQPAEENRFENATRSIWQSFRTRLAARWGEQAINGDGNNPALPYKWYFHMAWWQENLRERQHLLRQRIALALSELLVISDKSSLELDAVGMAGYYDLLYRHAFGNYRDLLYDVSLHPCMGIYLSHMNNRKANPAENIHPDENYAREIMQLFTIGLFELNPDGSRKQAHGQDIPTYNNEDIRQFARVFTGLKAAAYRYEWPTSFWQADYNGAPVSFEDGVDASYKTVPFVEMTRPMTAEESRHDDGEKNLLGGRMRLAAGQKTLAEIHQAVSLLVLHPNTAPFVAGHLIRQLVTANPAPAYVQAVADKFGPKGDLKAVIREIFTWPLHHEAASTRFASARREAGGVVQSQLLKSPVLRMTQLLRAFRADNSSRRLWLIGDDLDEALEQHPLSSPTVFNFYQDDFTPHGPLEKLRLVAPRFQLLNAATSIGWVNQCYYALFADWLPAVSTVISEDESYKNIPELDPEKLHRRGEDRLRLDFSDYLDQAADPSQHGALIDRLGILLSGEVPHNREAILDAFSSYADNPQWVIQTIIFFIVISPDYVVLTA